MTKLLLVLPLFLAGCNENEAMIEHEGAVTDTAAYALEDSIEWVNSNPAYDGALSPEEWAWFLDNVDSMKSRPTCSHILAVTDTVSIWKMPPAEKMSMVPDFDASAPSVPPKLTVASWAGFYDIPCSPEGKFLKYSFTPPATGSTVMRYGLRIEGEISAIGLPPEHLEGIKEYFKIYVPDGYELTYRTQVWGIDANDETGPESEWSDYPDTNQVEGIR